MTGARDTCLLCGQYGHLPIECPGERWPRAWAHYRGAA